jgi:hypothetical protein
MQTTITRDVLPSLFLPLAKSQAHVDHDDDDAYLTELVAQAIDDVERITNATIFERTITAASTEVAVAALWSWAVPGSANWISLPFNNVRDFAATDADLVDVSAAYTLRQVDPGGVGTAWLQGAAAAPAALPITFDIVAGMHALEEIAPALRRLILRRTAALYEYREAALPLSADDLNGEPALWRPDL